MKNLWNHARLATSSFSTAFACFCILRLCQFLSNWTRFVLEPLWLLLANKALHYSFYLLPASKLSTYKFRLAFPNLNKPAITKRWATSSCTERPQAENSRKDLGCFLLMGELAFGVTCRLCPPLFFIESRLRICSSLGLGFCCYSNGSVLNAWKT